jgi:hypothetical protein
LQLWASPISLNVMKKSAMAIMLLLRAAADEPNRPASSPLPAGYRLVFEQHFDSPESLLGLRSTDPGAWRWSDEGQSRALELQRQSQYQPKFRSPVNIALIGDQRFGDFILEVDLLQTGKEYGHRDMCLFYGVQDAENFYYTHIATKADPNAHNTFIVNGAPRKNFAHQTTQGVNWGLGVWHHVRLERKLSDGTIRVFFDDMTQPIMQAVDKTFGSGWIGFGSFDDTGKVDNLRIWSPTTPESTAPTFFKRLE